MSQQKDGVQLELPFDEPSPQDRPQTVFVVATTDPEAVKAALQNVPCKIQEVE